MAEKDDDGTASQLEAPAPAGPASQSDQIVAEVKSEETAEAEAKSAAKAKMAAITKAAKAVAKAKMAGKAAAAKIAAKVKPAAGKAEAAKSETEAEMPEEVETAKSEAEAETAGKAAAAKSEAEAKTTAKNGAAKPAAKAAEKTAATKPGAKAQPDGRAAAVKSGSGKAAAGKSESGAHTAGKAAAGKPAAEATTSGTADAVQSQAESPGAAAVQSPSQSPRPAAESQLLAVPASGGRRPSLPEAVRASLQNPSRLLTLMTRRPSSVSKQKRSGYGTGRALRTAYVLAICTGWLSLCLVAWYLIATHRQSGLTESHSASETLSLFTEVAVCLGPRISKHTIAEFLESSDENLTTIDDDHSYFSFFNNTFGWPGQPFHLMALPSVQQYIYGFNPKESVDDPKLKIHSTTIPMMYYYSLCRNVSFHGEPGYLSRRDGHLHYHFEIDDAVREKLFSISTYADVYVYPRGHFSEFNLVNPDVLPYRYDFQKPLSLHVEVEKRLCSPTKYKPCDNARKTAIGKMTSSGSHKRCTTWCLMRSLLRNSPCVMPFMQGYIYNLTALLDSHVTSNVHGKDASYRYEYHVWWWMREFIRKPLCRSAAEFRAMFTLFRRMYLSSPDALHPLTQQCLVQCPFDCYQYKMQYLSGGDTLMAPPGTQRQGTKMIIHLPFSYNMTTEVEQYRTLSLANHLMGLLACMFSWSLFGLHDTAYALVDTLLRRRGLVETPEQPPRKSSLLPCRRSRPPAAGGDEGGDDGEAAQQSPRPPGAGGDEGGDDGEEAEQSPRRAETLDEPPPQLVVA